MNHSRRRREARRAYLRHRLRSIRSRLRSATIPGYRRELLKLLAAYQRQLNRINTHHSAVSAG